MKFSGFDTWRPRFDFAIAPLSAAPLPNHRVGFWFKLNLPALSNSHAKRVVARRALALPDEAISCY